MSTKFTAKKIDLELELTTLDGKEEKLNVVGPINTKKCISIMEQWGKIEDDHNAIVKKNKELEEEGKEPLKIKFPYEVLAIQLALVYDKPKEWFMDNFEPQVLLEIVTHVADSIKIAKKKLKN